MDRKIMTLCILHVGGKVLLGMKKRGFGAGNYNGFGGKVDAGETVEDAAMREMKEESGLSVVLTAEHKLGILEFSFMATAELHEVHIYKVGEFEGEVMETEEMAPQWFDDCSLPYEQMWKDDPFWMPMLLTDKKFIGTFVFDTDNTIISQNLLDGEDHSL